MRIKVGHVINSMFTQRITIEQYGLGARINGRWKEGTPETISVKASIQALNGREHAALPEGVRDREAVEIFTRVELHGTADGANSDIVNYRGRKWRIVGAPNWIENGYWSGIMVKEQKVTT